MKYKLICTSYNTLSDGSLQLRNNWIEESNDEHLLELIEKYKLPDNFKYPSINSISEILEGTMEIGCSIHIRIVRFN